MLKPEVHILTNNLRVVYVEYPGAAVTHVGLLVQAGTRDEPGGKEGLAHFIEHCLFKGTKKRKSYHILNRLEVVGGELNAYTTKEETCLHASVMNGYAERAIELIADIAFNSVYPDKEIAKEKDVISDEIRSYLDTPYEQIFDDFEGLLFKGHPLGHPILGTEDSVRGLRRKDLLDFTRQHYDPSRMVFAVSSGLQSEKVLPMLERHFAGLSRAKTRQVRSKPTAYRRKIQVEKKPINQVHYIQGRPAYGLHSAKRFPLILLNNLLGGPGMNSRLNLNIREKYGFTYTIESGYHTYTDTGIFHVYFATDISHFEKTKKLLQQELGKVCSDMIRERQLSQYKEQLIGQIQLAQENRLSIVLSMAKSQLNLNTIIPLKEITEKINAITAVELLEVAREMLSPEKNSVLIYEPGL